MSEYQAAIGLASLDEWDENRILWMDVIGKLRNSLLDIGVSSQPSLREGYVTSTFVAELPDPAVKDLSLKIFEKNKIESRDWWGSGVHRMPRFADSPTIGALSNTNQLAQKTLGLPLFLDMSNAEVERVVSSLAEALQIHNSGYGRG
jgi:dTDP-4-amino-4,6-dideoxygalactose transaminase